MVLPWSKITAGVEPGTGSFFAFTACNDHAVFGFDRHFRIRRNWIFDLRERRPVLCRLTTNAHGNGSESLAKKAEVTAADMTKKILKDVP